MPIRLLQAHRLYQSGDFVLAPFARYEILNTPAGFASLLASAYAVKQPDERIATVEASLFIGGGVVLKAEYRDYRQHKQPSTADHYTLGN